VSKFSYLLHEFEQEFGWKSKVLARIIGSIGYFTICAEEKRLSNGWTREPRMFREQNAPAFMNGNGSLWSRLRAKNYNAQWVVPIT
jgi:hypothetical protein